jgi:hypothetical protein
MGWRLEGKSGGMGENWLDAWYAFEYGLLMRVRMRIWEVRVRHVHRAGDKRSITQRHMQRDMQKDRNGSMKSTFTIGYLWMLPIWFSLQVKYVHIVTLIRDLF